MNHEVIKMHSQLPIMLASVSRFNPELTLEVVQAWGDGTKTIREMFKILNDAIQGCNPVSLQK